MTLRDIRESIGVVPQDIVLIGGTIEENIRYGNTSATMEMIIQSAQRAQAWEFIERFPEGLSTVVGERGVKLSGGQRQRIAIARALLKNPPILILDEATSSLDAESEHLIKMALDELMTERTTIIIAHRLSTVRECDLIAVFNAGTIEHIGTHAALLDESPRYRHWCDLQFID
jgi:ABC-type multidrug transport system fused ATPase/permease subunit